MMKRKIVMLSLASFLRHLLSLLIIILDMTTYKTMKKDTNLITARRTKLNSISNISTKSRKVVYLTRLLTSRLLVQVSASLYSCATLLAPCCSKDGTFSILQWRWQKRRLLNELTPTFSTSRSRT